MKIADIFVQDIPGSSFHDTDLEVVRSYLGKLPGTVSVPGYALEYHQHQRVTRPGIQPHLQAATTLPVMPSATIVQERLNALRVPNLFASEQELYEKLRQLLGPETYPYCIGIY